MANQHVLAHVCTEGEGEKGGNNVASMIVDYLESQGLIAENDDNGNLFQKELLKW